VKLFKRARTGPATPTVLQSRRRPVTTCATCGERQQPFVYMEDGKHHCRLCARQLHTVSGIKPAGRRRTDPGIDDLFAE
jgi:hypothetical protein